MVAAVTKFLESSEDAIAWLDANTDLAPESFIRAYLEAALFSSIDDRGYALDDRFTVDDFEPEARARAVKDCNAFWRLAGELIADSPEDAGTDFWYTRNHHGVGFWDGDWDEHGDALSELANAFPSLDVFVDEQLDKVYFS